MKFWCTDFQAHFWKKKTPQSFPSRPPIQINHYMCSSDGFYVFRVDKNHQESSASNNGRHPGCPEGFTKGQGHGPRDKGWKHLRGHAVAHVTQAVSRGLFNHPDASKTPFDSLGCQINMSTYDAVYVALLEVSWSWTACRFNLLIWWHERGGWPSIHEEKQMLIILLIIWLILTKTTLKLRVSLWKILTPSSSSSPPPQPSSSSFFLGILPFTFTNPSHVQRHLTIRASPLPMAWWDDDTSPSSSKRSCQRRSAAVWKIAWWIPDGKTCYVPVFFFVCVCVRFFCQGQNFMDVWKTNWKQSIIICLLMWWWGLAFHLHDKSTFLPLPAFTRIFFFFGGGWELSGRSIEVMTSFRSCRARQGRLSMNGWYLVVACW